MIPSVTRVFSKTKDMYVFLQAYEATLQTTRPMVGFVAFYQGQNKVFETPPIQVSTPGSAPSKPMPLRFTVPLADVKPGMYNCQVSVLDPEGPTGFVLGSAYRDHQLDTGWHTINLRTICMPVHRTAPSWRSL